MWDRAVAVVVAVAAAIGAVSGGLSAVAKQPQSAGKATVDIPLIDVSIVKPVAKGKAASVDVLVLVATGAANSTVVDTTEHANGASAFAKLADDAAVRIGHAQVEVGKHDSVFAADISLPMYLSSGAQIVAGARAVGRCTLVCVDGRFDVWPDSKTVPAGLLAGFKGATRIPLRRDAYGRPVCTVAMDGVKITNCLIDTGCVVSTLDPATFRKGPTMWASMLALERLPYPITGWGADVLAFVVDEIAFCPGCSTSDTAALNQSCVVDGPELDVPRPIGPTIGLSTLCKFNWMMDLRRNALWLKPRLADSGSPAMRPMALRMRVIEGKDGKLDLRPAVGRLPAMPTGAMAFEPSLRFLTLEYTKSTGRDVEVGIPFPSFRGRIAGLECTVTLDTGSDGCYLSGSNPIEPSPYDRITEDAAVHIGRFGFPLRRRLGNGALAPASSSGERELNLGAPCLNGLVLVYTNSHLRLFHDRKEIPSAIAKRFVGAAKVPLVRGSYGRPMCAADFDGVKAAKCFIDTGCTITTIDQATYLKGPKAWAKNLSKLTLPIGTWDGPSWESMFLARRVKIGASEVVDTDLVLLAPEPKDPEDRTVEAGYTPTIGLSTLCRFDWILDLKGRTLWLKKR